MTQAGFEVGYVGPNQNSAVSLSTGIYSLSARSNVPFVSLIGRSGFKKIFTWGEIVEVPKNEACTVRNESFHGGDIYINAGCDTGNRPARITVPVPYNLNTFDLWSPLFPADVRLARRAYLYFDAASNGTPVVVYTVGLRNDGSHNTSNQIDPTILPFVPGSGYEDSYLLPLFTMIGLLPLGHLAVPGDDTRPHALLTSASVLIGPNITLAFTSDNLPNAYYSMEY